MAATYESYLRLDELLALQSPRSDGPEHDEWLFITIHQVYELWFAQILHELDHLRPALVAGDGPTALATLRRILTILKTLVAQVDVLETMTPTSFGSFRARLDAASGFQSVQFREIEFALGLRPLGVVLRRVEDPAVRVRLAARAAAPSLYDGLLAFLAARGEPVPPELLGRASAEPIEDARVRALLVSIYRDADWGRAALRELCERFVDLDEGVQEWRYRHVKMVERTIGRRPGTGGSAGVAYLASTLMRPLFPDLWAIRSEL